MKGTNRLIAFDTNPFSRDPNPFIRFAGGPLFYAQQAEKSDQLSGKTPKLDKQRAESSRQYVRALNTQFASWVQTQLQNHPDELWEDGIQDYLNHASFIMEKYKDVVDWLKANATKGLGLPLLEFQTTQKTAGSENKENNIKLSMEQPVFPMASSSSSFVPSWNSGPLFNNKSPFSFGQQTYIPQIQTALPMNNDTSNDADADAEDDVKQPSSPSCLVKINFGSIAEDGVKQPSSPSVEKTEEKGITVVHEVKCKLYIKCSQCRECGKSLKEYMFNNNELPGCSLCAFRRQKNMKRLRGEYLDFRSTDPTEKDAWKDRGTGQLSIKCKEGFSKGTWESKPIVLVRNDAGKVLLNALVYPGIKTKMQKNSIVTIFHTAEGENNDNVLAHTCVIRLKSVEDRDELARVIKEYTPTA